MQLLRNNARSHSTIMHLNNVDSTMKRASSVYSKEMDQWLSSFEALEVKKMELEIESQFMNEACLELNNTIEHSIQNERKKKKRFFVKERMC